MFEVHCCCEHQKLPFSLAVFSLLLAFEHPFCSSPSCTESCEHGSQVLGLNLHLWHAYGACILGKLHKGFCLSLGTEVFPLCPQEWASSGILCLKKLIKHRNEGKYGYFQKINTIGVKLIFKSRRAKGCKRLGQCKITSRVIKGKLNHFLAFWLR